MWQTACLNHLQPDDYARVARMAPTMGWEHAARNLLRPEDFARVRAAV